MTKRWGTDDRPRAHGFKKAASGDARAIAQLVTLLQATDRQGDEPATQLLAEADQPVMARILHRLTRQAKKGGAPHGSDSDPS